MPLDERIEYSQETWPGKLLKLTKCNKTLTGCIVIAILGRAPDNPPRFVQPTARIDEFGRIICALQHRWQVHGQCERDFIVGTTIAVRDDLRALADAAKLSDTERQQFFTAFAKWIERDERAIKSSVITSL